MRFFAAARDAAGTREVSVPPQALGTLLDALRARARPRLRRGAVDAARVWVNGEDPVDGAATTLHAGDEVAVVPPVSGGAGRASPPPTP